MFGEEGEALEKPKYEKEFNLVFDNIKLSGTTAREQETDSNFKQEKNVLHKLKSLINTTNRTEKKILETEMWKEHN
jgi:hypothetical protein